MSAHARRRWSPPARLRRRVGLLLAAALAACTERGSPAMQMTTSDVTTTTAPNAVVRAALNEHLAHVVRESSYRVELSDVLDNSSKVIAEPVTFEYAGAGAGASFRLPLGRYVALSHFGGWIYNITVTPQLAAGSLADAVAAAGASARALAGTAWVASRKCGDVVDPTDRARWDDPGTTTALVGCYAAGAAELRILIERDEAQPSDRALGDTSDARFYVSVELSDVSRLERYQKHVMARRRAVAGSAVRPLPIGEFLADTVAP